MLRLLQALGTYDQIVWQKSPQLILVDQSKSTTMQFRALPAPLHLFPTLLNVPQLTTADLLSNGRVLWQILRLTEQKILELDGLNAEQHLRKMGVSERAIDWFWRTAAMTITNTPLDICSAGALFRFVRFLSGRDDFLFGFAGIGLGDLFTPAAARRISADGGQVLWLRTVSNLMVDNGAVTGVELADGKQLHASTVIAAVPPDELAKFIPTAWPDRHECFAHLHQFKPSPYICTYLWFADKLTHEPFWTKVWTPDNLNYDFYDLTNIKPSLAGKPSLIASNCMHSVKFAALSDEEIVFRTRAEIVEYLPAAARSEILHSRVHRIPMGIVRSTPGIEARRPNSTTPITGFYLAGDWINTGLPSSMESAARSGWLAAEQVLAAAGKPCSLAQPLPDLTGLAKKVAQFSKRHHFTR
ncbi:MAG: FAD-dependent oxidoreductase, partial [Natronospirillum sp.]